MNKNPVRLRLACFFGGTQASLSMQYVLDGFAFYGRVFVSLENIHFWFKTRAVIRLL